MARRHPDPVHARPDAPPSDDAPSDVGSRGAVPVVVAAVVLVLVPFVPLVLHAFGEQYFFPQVVPDTLTLDGWRRALLGDRRLWSSALSSVRIALLVTVLSLVIGTPAARAMGAWSFRGRSLVEFLLLAPVLVPTVAIGLGLQLTFVRLGLSGRELGVVLVHLVPALPYSILILSGVFANHRPEFEEQARSLGATRLRAFWCVTMPAIAPGLAVAGFFAFLVSWSQYVLTLLIGGGSVLTLPLLVFSLVSGGDLRLTGVVSLVFVVPAVLLLVVVSRFLTPGALTPGATTPGALTHGAARP